MNSMTPNSNCIANCQLQREIVLIMNCRELKVTKKEMRTTEEGGQGIQNFHIKLAYSNAYATGYLYVVPTLQISCFTLHVFHYLDAKRNLLTLLVAFPLL
uniref:Putative ovule protein n=1 Tax=Solanum chacoense TaxID=4108 RepID=A0A0V0IF25_SOLCH